ncbi:MAG: GMC oxidoreductase [Janthinobacterium lividum]
MSIDDLRSVDNASVLKTDLCLVGSGPSGWCIAEELRNSGLRILMVESGGRSVEPETAALNEIEDVGTPLFNGRTRVLGGTSNVWNGRCMPFDDIDYQERSWVPQSGWPFDAAEMAPYVDRASEHLGAGPYHEGTRRRPLPAGLQPRPEVDPTLMCSTCWENPAQIDFGPILTTRRNPNLWVLLRATVTHLNTDDSGRVVQSVEVMDADGRRLTIHARAVVLCAGGVENPRILLYSNRQQLVGLGNQHDVVGRYLMDHPRDFELIARFDAPDVNAFRDLFGPYKLDSIRGRHEFSYGFKLSEEQQRAEQLLNTAAWPYEVQAADDAIEAARRLIKGPRKNAVGDAGLVVSQAGLIVRGLHTRLVKGQRVRRKVERIGFLVSSEQVPNPESRVQLAERKDWLGLPITKINWQIAELEARSHAALARTIASEFERLALPRVQLAEWVKQGRFADAKFVDGCHPMGTTRMAINPRNGVVDADCQVHGVDKLYVAGSSVFPTASHANPTLMIIALAVRLSDHLKKTLSPKSGPGVTKRANLVLAD